MLTALSTCKERANCGSITLKEVSLATFEGPLAGLFEFSETVLLQVICAPLHCVEVALRVGQSFNNVLGVDLAVRKERL